MVDGMSEYEDRPGVDPDPVETDDGWVEHLEEVEVSAFDRMMDYDDEATA